MDLVVVLVVVDLTADGGFAAAEGLLAGLLVSLGGGATVG